MSNADRCTGYKHLCLNHGLPVDGPAIKRIEGDRFCAPVKVYFYIGDDKSITYPETSHQLGLQWQQDLRGRCWVHTRAQPLTKLNQCSPAPPATCLFCCPWRRRRHIKCTAGQSVKCLPLQARLGNVWTASYQHLYFTVLPSQFRIKRINFDT